MKLYVTSDLHLEFADLDLRNQDEVDVLILSGDICVAKDLDRPDARGDQVRGFFQRISKDFPEIVYVMGNHEFYHGDFAKTQDLIQQTLDRLSITNIHLLEKSTWQHQDWLFIGGTLWTDFNGADPLTLWHAQQNMNDFGVTKNSAVPFYRFTPEHALADHQRMKDYIHDVIQDRRDQGRQDRRVIVVGHHSPSRLSTHPRYQGDEIMNGCYSNRMEEFIMDRPEIALFTHGHTHEDFDYTIGSTRIVCNPRGYMGYEARAESWQPKLIELET
jgi:Icc-related predicted phosphoesterase